MSIIVGDCIAAMAALPEASIDAVVSDPPYGLEFMGAAWDAPWKDDAIVTDPAAEGGAQDGAGGNAYSRARVRYQGTANQRQRREAERADPIKAKYLDHSVEYDRRPARLKAWHLSWLREAFRILKPGGHILAMSGTRTYHHIASAAEDAGFEIRDMLAWMYGSGFPKSLDVSKAIDKAAGVKPIGSRPSHSSGILSPEGDWNKCNRQLLMPPPTTDDAKQWQGFGTALKPAHEPILLARKPLIGTVAANVEKHGTGALNIDGCRVEHDEQCILMAPSRANIESPSEKCRQAGRREPVLGLKPSGRWPANVILDPEAAAILDEQSGELPSRFFYVAKPSQHERSAGTDDRNSHPTVKPIALMRWLARLITPPGATLLDPFLGSGTTAIAANLEGFRWIGIERDPAYADIARKRISWWKANGERGWDARPEPETEGQMRMFKPEQEEAPL